jgi:hypothetical protein
MTLVDLITLFRNEVDDVTQPYLWSDDEAVEFANDAQLEASRRARLLVDSSTPAITRLAVSAGAALLTLDPRVLFVRRARFAGALPLRRMNMQDMEAYDPFWQDAAPGTPRAFVPDYETGKLLLWPTPDTDGNLQLSVVRDPLADMQADEDSPEIAPRYHRSLRFWMMARAYGKQDSQANDPKKELASLALFEQEFGKKSAAIDEAWIAREQMEGDGTF